MSSSTGMKSTTYISRIDIQSFSRDILLFLMDYIDYEDQVDFICCSREWYYSYMKKYIRRLTLTSDCVKDWRRKIGRLLENPFHQLKIRFPLSFWECDFVSGVDRCSCSEMELAARQFISLMRTAGRLRAQKVSIKEINGTLTTAYQQLRDSFSMLTDCQTLSLQFQYGKGSDVIPIPLLPTIQSLTVTFGLDIISSLVPFIGQLQQLILVSCSINDVSLLGAIPHLELRNCNQVVDISALNDNQQIVIYGCAIQDYSQSFRHSAKIDVTTYRKDARFDLQYWQKVTDLSLNGEGMSFLRQPLPPTVKRCRLVGDFVHAVDFRVSAAHELRELSLSHSNRQIKSLEGYGFDRLTVIHLENLDKLQSLQGVGGGATGGRRSKIRKVTVIHCNSIKDFSPLQQTPIVAIINCSGFIDPMQVRLVPDLTLSPKTNIRFPTSQDGIRNPFASIQSLTLFSVQHVTEKEGIAQIPRLQLHIGRLLNLQRFLLASGQLANPHIEILDLGNSTMQACQRRLFEFQNRHLYQYYYQFENQYPYGFGKGSLKRWIWVKK